MNLLKKLYEIHSPSRNERVMKKFIKGYVKKHIPGVTFRSDHVGNLYMTRGNSETYPCIVAHLDQVQREHSKDFKAIETEDIIFGYSPDNSLPHIIPENFLRAQKKRISMKQSRI